MNDQSDKDLHLWHAWKKDPGPEKLSNLLGQMKPLLHSATRGSQGSLAPAVIEAEAKLQAVKAFRSYDPTKSTKLSTHVSNYLQKVNRLKYKHQDIFAVPEARRLKYQNFQFAREDLEHTLGREPTMHELAEHLGWSQAEVMRFNAEDFKEQSDSLPHMSDTRSHDSNDANILSYVYHDLHPTHKAVFEHTTGFNGRAPLSNEQVMKKTGLTQGQLSYAKQRIAKQIRDMRGGTE